MTFLRPKRLEKKTSDAREPSLYRSICTSIISTLLSLVMLVGTTFAWFTDSITSNVFTITAGSIWTTTSYHIGDENLTANEGWTLLNNTSDIFGGVTFSKDVAQTVYLKLENKGRNAVKYKINLFKVGDETEGLLSVDSTTIDGIATYANDAPEVQPVLLSEMMSFEYVVAEGVNEFLVATQSGEDTLENSSVQLSESAKEPFEIEVPAEATRYVKLTLKLEYDGEWASLPSISLKLKIIITQPGNDEEVILENEQTSQQQNETENVTEPAEDVKKPIVTVGVDMTTEIETPAQPAAQPQQPATGKTENNDDNAVGSNENDGDTDTAGNGEDANTVGDTTDDTNTSGAAEDGGNAGTSDGAVDTAADTAAVEPNTADDAPAADPAA